MEDMFERITALEQKNPVLGKTVAILVSIVIGIIILTVMLEGWDLLAYIADGWILPALRDVWDFLHSVFGFIVIFFEAIFAGAALAFMAILALLLELIRLIVGA